LRVARIYLWLGLVASVIFGGAYLVAPAWITSQMGIGHTTAAGLTDLRATYAGFQLGMAVLLGWCLRDESRYVAGLVAFTSLVSVLALSRALGLALDGFSLEMAIATILELGIACFGLYALSSLRRQHG
jgi:hypothetical protein